MMKTRNRLNGRMTIITTLLFFLTFTPLTAFTAEIPLNAQGNVPSAPFDELQQQIDELSVVVVALQTDLATANNTIATLQADLATANNLLNTHASQISAINSSNIMALNSYVALTNDGRGPLATFSGLNLQLVNGTGSTGGIPNGLGNFIIGYDFERFDGDLSCSLGVFATQFECEADGHTWALSHKSGSHYLIVGELNNYSQYGGLVVGIRNTSSGGFSSVSGGNNNAASGEVSSVSGGSWNTASGFLSSVSGGYGNTASGSYSSVSGGSNRSANGESDWAAGPFWEDM